MSPPSLESRALLGVLGGMGPAATADFLTKIVKVTPAQRDQQHIPTLVCSIPQIPDRTEALLGGGASPLPAMLRALRLLEAGGASLLAIPCNTAHHWFDELQRRTPLRIVHIVDATLDVIRSRGMGATNLGLLATTGTVATGVHARRLAKFGIGCITPSSPDQVRVMEVIRAVKGTGPDDADSGAIHEITARLVAQGASAVILGCTELPLVIRADSGPYVDATEALARACVRELRSQPRAAAACLENTAGTCKLSSITS